MNNDALSFQDMILTLHQYWSKQGCVILNSYDKEVGAGTYHPATLLRALGPQSWNCAYVQPSRRPTDGRYGQNPNRLYMHHQYQVILKPSPENSQELLLGAYEAIGLDPSMHDIRFVEDDWENPTIGAWGLGWEVWCDGMEITQFTYFQGVGGIEVNPVCTELTIGLERLAVYLQDVESVYDLRYNDTMSYRDVFLMNEQQQSGHAFDNADTDRLLQTFANAEAECQDLVTAGLPLPAYEQCMMASHSFNLLDARGVISVVERASYIGRIRNLVKGCCELYLEQVSESFGGINKVIKKVPLEYTTSYQK